MPLPESIAARIGRALVTPIRYQWSDASVYRVETCPPAYLKVARTDALWPVSNEADRVEWARAEGLPCPDWSIFGTVDGTDYLLTAALPGHTLRDDEQRSPDEVVTLFAAAIRRVHELPVSACPFTCTPEERLATVERAVRAGRTDLEYCRELTGLDQNSALAEARDLVADIGNDDVVLHGDAYTRNLLIDDDGSWGWIDWGECGVGHRALDLNHGMVSVEHLLGLEWVEPFLAAYDGPPVDEPAVRFFRLLDGLT